MRVYFVIILIRSRLYVDRWTRSYLKAHSDRLGNEDLDFARKSLMHRSQDYQRFQAARALIKKKKACHEVLSLLLLIEDSRHSQLQSHVSVVSYQLSQEHLECNLLNLSKSQFLKVVAEQIMGLIALVISKSVLLISQLILHRPRTSKKLSFLLLLELAGHQG